MAKLLSFLVLLGALSQPLFHAFYCPHPHQLCTVATLIDCPWKDACPPQLSALVALASQFQRVVFPAAPPHRSQRLQILLAFTLPVYYLGHSPLLSLSDSGGHKFPRTSMSLTVPCYPRKTIAAISFPSSDGCELTQPTAQALSSFPAVCHWAQQAARHTGDPNPVCRQAWSQSLPLTRGLCLLVL